MRVIALIFLIFFGLPAAAQDRMALVIGNDGYAEVPKLQKAAADARAVSSRLRDLGFETIEGIDLDRREMNRTISRFTAALEPGDTAFVFFAGHGIEIDGENYLLPVDIAAPDTGESDFVKSESIALSALLDRVRATGARMSITIVDACRNNPFETVAGRSIGRTRGLGRIAAPQGTFVIFSAGAGQLALDELHEDDGAENSVFTRALLPRLSQPGLELRTLVADLRVEVRDMARTVSHTQVPAYYDELLGEFYFTPAAAKLPTVGDTEQVDDAMRADLDLARSIGTPEAIEAFLDRYADQSDAFGYQVALKLRESLETPQEIATAAPVKRDAEPVVTDSPAPVSVPYSEVVAEERRDIVRATQRALNAAGCAAGGADGVIGPRTRRAFQAWLSETGSTLTEADLGTEAARQAVAARKGPVCPQATATTATTAPAPQSAGTARLSMAGSWSYKSSCPLLIKSKGTVRFRKAGANFFHGRVADAIAQNANSEVYLNGREITGTDYYPGLTVKWRGRLAADGNSYTASGSTGCSVYAWRTG